MILDDWLDLSFVELARPLGLALLINIFYDQF